MNLLPLEHVKLEMLKVRAYSNDIQECLNLEVWAESIDKYLREREAAKAAVTDNVQRVAKHMAHAVEYIDKVYPGAKQLGAAPIMRNLRRWSRLLATASQLEESARVLAVDAMVSRFLSWRLPDSFSPDAGISFDRSFAERYPASWPVGTNLLTADQAEQMVRHLLSPDTQHPIKTSCSIIPTYYVAHPDGSYSIASPQPVLLAAAPKRGEG